MPSLNVSLNLVPLAVKLIETADELFFERPALLFPLLLLLLALAGEA